LDFVALDLEFVEPGLDFVVKNLDFVRENLEIVRRAGGLIPERSRSAAKNASPRRQCEMLLMGAICGESDAAA
jgi:hypothetical protein